MKIGVLSDTHAYLPPAAHDFFKGCQQIWHAGDVGNSALLDELQLIAPIQAVYGNIDDWDVRSVCPEYRFFSCEEHQVALMHIGGRPGYFSALGLKIIQNKKPTIFVTGHSHVLLVKYDPQHQLLFINPGAAGKYGIHQRITFLRFDINGHKIENLEIFDAPK